MIPREMSKIAKRRAREFPVLTITGPRQSGKTTLAKTCFPSYEYVNLEDPETRDIAESDYRRFFAMYRPMGLQVTPPRFEGSDPYHSPINTCTAHTTLVNFTKNVGSIV